MSTAKATPMSVGRMSRLDALDLQHRGTVVTTENKNEISYFHMQPFDGRWLRRWGETEGVARIVSSKPTVK